MVSCDGFRLSILITLAVNVVIFLVAFSTPEWVSQSGGGTTIKTGLWEACVCPIIGSCICQDIGSNFEDWFYACQAMFTISLIAQLAAGAGIVLYIFLFTNMVWLIRLVSAGVWLAFVLNLIGLIIWIVKWLDIPGAEFSMFHWAFYIMAVSTFMCTVVASLASKQMITANTQVHNAAV